MAAKPTYAELENRINDLEIKCNHYQKTEAELIRKIQAAVVIHDAEGRIIHSNPTAIELLGITDNEIMGRTPEDPSWKFLDVDGKNLRIEKFPVNQVLNSGQSLKGMIGGIVRPCTADIKWVIINAEPMRDSLGKITQVLVTFMDVTERRQAEAAFQESEARYRAISGLTSDYAYSYRVEPNGELVNEWVAGAVEQLTGYTREEVTARGGWESLIYPEDMKIPMRQLQKIYSNQSATIEYRIFDRAGNVRWLRDFAEPVWDENEDRLKQILGAVQEITDQKAAEEEVKEAYEIIKESPAVAFLWQKVEGWPVEYVSENVVSLLGYTAEEVMSGKVSYVDVVHPADLDRVGEEVETFSAEKGRERFNHKPYRIVAQDGTVKWVRDTTSIKRDQNGNITHYHGIVEDITETIEAEEALRESETLFRTLVENSQAGIFLVDEHYCFVYANEELSHILGFGPNEIEGIDFRSVLDEESREFVADRYVRRQKGEDVPSRYEVGIVRQDGEKRRLEMVATAIPNPDGSVQTMGQVLDITDRKQAEKSLRESEERFRELAENIREVFWLFDWEKQQVLYVSPAYEEVWGRSILDLYEHYEEWGNSVHPHDAQYAEASFAKILETGGGEDREYRIVRPDGSVRWVLDRGFAIKGNDGQIKRIAGIAEDITERKKAKEMLRESEELYSNILESMSEGILAQDKNFHYTHWNSAMEKISKTPREEVVGNKKLPWDIFPHLAEQGVDEMMQMAMRGEVVSRENIPYRLGDGTEGFTREKFLPLKTSDGDIRGIVGVIRDVTEEVRSESELREMHQKLQALIQASPIAITLLDLEGNITLWSPAAEKIFGWRAEEVLGIPIPIIPTESKADFEQNFQMVILGGNITGMEVCCQKKGGTPVDVSLSVVPLHNAEGEISGVAGMMTDISERKQMEKALQASEIRFRSQVEQSPFSTLIFAPDGRLVYGNPASEKLWSLTPEQAHKRYESYNILQDKLIIDKGLLTYIQRGFAGEFSEIPPIKYDPKQLNPAINGAVRLPKWWLSTRTSLSVNIWLKNANV